MMRSMTRIAALVLACGLMAACDGGDNDDDDGGGGGGGGAAGGGGAGAGGGANLQGIFGVNFDAAFNNGIVDPTADPNAVAPGDIIPVSRVTDPRDIPNP